MRLLQMLSLRGGELPVACSELDDPIDVSDVASLPPPPSIIERAHRAVAGQLGHLRASKASKEGEVASLQEELRQIEISIAAFEAAEVKLSEALPEAAVVGQASA